MHAYDVVHCTPEGVRHAFTAVARTAGEAEDQAVALFGAWSYLRAWKVRR